MFHTGGDCAACQPFLFPTVPRYQQRFERSPSPFSAGVESSLQECFYRGNVFQTMTLPDAVIPRPRTVSKTTSI